MEEVITQLGDIDLDVDILVTWKVSQGTIYLGAKRL